MCTGRKTSEDSKTYYMQFAAAMVSHTGLSFSDDDFKRWYFYAKTHYDDADSAALDLFTVWANYLSERGMTLCHACWNRCLEDKYYED